MPERCAVWRDAGAHWQVDKVAIERTARGAISVTAYGRLPDVHADYAVTYTLYGTGDLVVDATYKAADNKKRPEMPRFGMTLAMPGGYEQMAWYGRGPHESHWDRKDGYAVSVYRGTVDEQFVDYSEPQENANKTDVRWLTLTNAEGQGLLAVGMPLLSVSARHYSMKDLETQKHTWQMTRQDETLVNLDMQQMGVGGDNSWGAKPHPQYLLTDAEYRYQFRLRPLAPDDNPADLARQRLP